MKMRTLTVVALATISCGVDAQHVAESAATKPSTEIDYETESVVIMPYYRMTVTLVNASPYERICSFSYSYRDWDLSLVSGPQMPVQNVGPSQSISAVATNVPLNQVVSLAAACWHPGYPGESSVQAASSLRTPPMFGHIACHAIYAEDGGGSFMYLSCQ